MSIVIAGTHHRHAPLPILEALSVLPEDVPKLLSRLTDSADVREAIVLSTCQRVEVIADAVRFHDAVQHIIDVFADHARTPATDLLPHLETWFDEGAASHLFGVASGLDSVVLGESEVLSQVKHAAAVAESEGTLGRALRPLVRHALEAAKRVRTETGIARGHASVASAAVDLVASRLDITGATVAVLGAGQAAAAAARSLVARGGGDVVVVNRSRTAAEMLAAEFGGRAVALADLPHVLRDASVVVCSTASPRPLLTPGIVATAAAGRRGRQLALVDISLPRDVHPDVAAIPGVSVIDLDDVSAHAALAASARRTEAERGIVIVAEEVERWRQARALRTVDPAVIALRTHAEAISAGEMAQRMTRLGHLDDTDKAEIELLVRAIVRKLMHGPTAALRAHAADPDIASLVDAMSVLFDLDFD